MVPGSIQAGFPSSVLRGLGACGGRNPMKLNSPRKAAFAPLSSGESFVSRISRQPANGSPKGPSPSPEPVGPKERMPFISLLPS